MAFDVEAARADGYTDEDIQRYLATKDQPLPAEQPRDRSEEQLGVATSAIPAVGSLAKDVGMLGAELYAGKKLIYDPLMKRFGPGSAPVAPTTPTTPTPLTPQQQTFNALKATDAQNAARATQQPSIMQRGMDYARQMQQIAAQRVMPVAGAAAMPAAVGAMGAGMTYGAANQLRNMSPEQRRQLMGDIGSDTGFAAAIMNQGR